MSLWYRLQNLFQLVCSISAVTTNYTLLTLILYRSPSSLGAYKYLMIYISVFEILYAIFEVVVLPDMYSNNSGFIVVIDSHRAVLPKEWLQFLNYVFCGSFGVSMAIFAIHFVFRYLVVSGKKSWTNPDTWKVLLWLTIPLICGTVWATSCAIFVGPSAAADQFLREEVLDSYHAKLEELFYVGPVFESQKPNTEAFTGLMIMTVILFISFFTMFYYGIKCHCEVRIIAQKATCSSRYRRLQAELFYGLVAQSLIPITLLHAPATLVFFSTFFGKSRVIYGKILTVTNAIYPVLDPLPNMIIIKNYRRAILDNISSFKTRRIV